MAPTTSTKQRVSEHLRLRIWTNQELALVQIINIWRHKKCLQRSNYPLSDKTLKECSIKIKDTVCIIFFPSHHAVKPLQISYLKDIEAFVSFGIWGVKYAAINSLYVRVDSLLVACNENQIGKTFIPLAKKSHIIMSPQRGICHLDKKRWLNYQVQEIRELERGNFYGIFSLGPLQPGAYWKTWPFPKWSPLTQGSQKPSHHLLDRLVLYFLLLILHCVLNNCEWCTQFYKSPDTRAHRYMAYGCSNTVNLRQQGYKQREKGIKNKSFSKVC